MEYEIIWSPEIQEEIKDINDKLLEEWGFQIAEKFANNLIDTIENLRYHPQYWKKTSSIECG